MGRLWKNAEDNKAEDNARFEKTKSVITATYKGFFDTHIKDTAEIVSMGSFTLPSGLTSSVKCVDDLAACLSNNPSASHAKMAAFILFYSCKTSYDVAFKQTWAVAMEQEVMREMNVGYGELNEVSQTGCVAVQGAALFAKYITTFRQKCNSKLNVKQSRPVGFPPRKASDTVFYIQYGAGDWTEVSKIQISKEDMI